MKPIWCRKESPCDFDHNSAYCPHRECRKQLLEDYAKHLTILRVIGDNYTKRGLIKRLTSQVPRKPPEKPHHIVCKYCGAGARFGGTLYHEPGCTAPRNNG